MQTSPLQTAPFRFLTYWRNPTIRRVKSSKTRSHSSSSLASQTPESTKSSAAHQEPTLHHDADDNVSARTAAHTTSPRQLRRLLLRRRLASELRPALWLRSMTLPEPPGDPALRPDDHAILNLSSGASTDFSPAVLDRAHAFPLQADPVPVRGDELPPGLIVDPGIVGPSSADAATYNLTRSDQVSPPAEPPPRSPLPSLRPSIRRPSPGKSHQRQRPRLTPPLLISPRIPSSIAPLHPVHRIRSPGPQSRAVTGAAAGAELA